MQSKCCYIPKDEQEKAMSGEATPGCLADAQWHIQSDNTVDGYTESCTDHVGHMLGMLPLYIVTPLDSSRSVDEEVTSAD
jgi:hypothetical protein